MTPALRLLRSVFAVLLLFAVFPATIGVAAGPSEKTRQRIDSLLRHRLKPDPLPVDLPNPFLVIRGSVGFARADAPEKEDGERKKTAGENAEVLARHAAELKIGGVVWLKDQVLQIFINDLLLKVGDFITLDRNDATIRIQVVGIQPGLLILRLDEAVHTVRF